MSLLPANSMPGITQNASFECSMLCSRSACTLAWSKSSACSPMARNWYPFRLYQRASSAMVIVPSRDSLEWMCNAPLMCTGPPGCRSEASQQVPNIGFPLIPARTWIVEAKHFVMHVSLIQLHEIERRLQLGGLVARKTICYSGMSQSDQQVIQVTE